MGEGVQSVCTIPSEPFLDGAAADADDWGGFLAGFTASKQSECLEASGELGVGFVFVACVELLGGVFPAHYEFSSTHRCFSYVRSPM
jgi:hypothetical protein